MLKTKIIALCAVGSILLGGTGLGVSVSSLQSDNEPKAIVSEAVLADEINVEPISYGEDGLEPKGELACELIEEPKDGLACELTEEPKDGLACELTEEPKDGLACELTEEPKGELACELTEEPKDGLACELTEEPKDGLACELTEEPKGELACELTEEPKGELACELTEEPKGELACELTVEPKGELASMTNEVDIYNIVLDYFISLDEALNSDMKYIAVNFDASIDKENKEKVIENLKKYNVDIIEGNVEELMAKGLGDEYGNLDGILLSISDVKIESENKIIINGSKYRSGLGSISTQVTINNDNGTWKIEESSPQIAS
ncbi:hypothetical protein [Clostridium ganghwense]|uniref:DUF4878 domain-containing protein n=1 Tax=Clostridium ganghwense TaxID=312089 RepID=A0ABT4CNU6_9CLOT|nr:hypothetical protein [Clostridium ganghwense]MCY6370623.1 hypothetical protein [Clostridium ganghwense]